MGVNIKIKATRKPDLFTKEILAVRVYIQVETSRLVYVEKHQLNNG